MFFDVEIISSYIIIFILNIACFDVFIMLWVIPFLICQVCSIFNKKKIHHVKKWFTCRIFSFNVCLKSLCKFEHSVPMILIRRCVDHLIFQICLIFNRLGAYILTYTRKLRGLYICLKLLTEKFHLREWFTYSVFPNHVFLIILTNLNTMFLWCQAFSSKMW